MEENNQFRREPAWDNLRTIAMLLGVVFHANLIFVLDPVPWIGKHSGANAFSSMMTWGLHNFRMHLFFLISGYLTVGALKKQGTETFIKKRLKKLIVPLALAALTTLPLCYWLWSIQGISFFEGGLPPGFLWFLVYLICYSLLAVPLMKIVPRIQMSFAIRFSFALIILSTLHFLMKNYTHIDDPAGHWIPRPFTFLFYGTFFFYGMLERNVDQKRSPWPFLVLACLLWVASYAGYDPSKIGQNLYPGPMKWIPAVSTSLYSLCAVLGAVYWGRQYLQECPKILRVFKPLSFWIYLTHIPVVVLLQILAMNIAVPWSLILTAMVLASVIFLGVLYRLLVKGTWLEEVLS